jgi:hypothetical protein
MQHLRTIEIDFDIHKMIEAERRSFDDPPNAALRRLLKLPEKTDEQSSTKLAGRSWSSEGAVLPAGTKVKMHYGDQLIEGEIIEGKWVCNGQTFDTPSAAASAMALTKDGQTTSLNGWNYWEAKLPGSAEWVPIKSLRSQPVVSTFKRRFG